MTKLIQLETTIKHVSKQRPKSLILRIPGTIRDMMQFEHGTSISIEVCLNENNEKYIKIKKQD